MPRRRLRRTRAVFRLARRRVRLHPRFWRGLLFGSSLGALVIVVGCLTSQQERGGISVVAPPSGAKAPVRIDRQIRVRLLSARPVPALTIEVRSPYTLTESRGGRRLIPPGPPLPESRVSPAQQSPAGIVFGGLRVDCDDVLLEPQRDGAVVLDGRAYRGALRIRREGDGLAAINVLDMEAYLRGVLRGELPANFHPQAQRALAVAARSYALYEKLTTPSSQDYDVLADERSQMYIGIKGEDAPAVAAVDDTRGMVCLAPVGGVDKSFSTYYSSCCGGMSQPVREFRPSDPDVAPLEGRVACEFCATAPPFRWGPVRISKADVTRRVMARYPKLTRLGQITQVAAESTSADGRVTRVRLTGSSGASETLVGEDFRLCLGGHVVRSTRYKLADRGKLVEFREGRGFGHGVGLCQYGADGQARTGRGYQDILQFYYPGCVLRRIY